MRTRADQLLVDRGLAESRSRAQALILAGKVFSGERRVAKAGDALAPDTPLEVRGQDHPWASRGGLKLDHALHHFGLSPAAHLPRHRRLHRRLHRRASGALCGEGACGRCRSWRACLEAAERPSRRGTERTNARYLTHDTITDPIGALVCDASFIGLATLLPATLALCSGGAWAVALIKPQFEAGPGAVGSKGVVRDPAVHKAVCERIKAWWTALPDWRVIGITESPITGPEGNREFLIASERA